MKRRDFIALAGASAATAAVPRIALAQQAAKMPRVAFVYTVGLPPEYIEGFLQGLADYGYVDGKTIALDTYVAPTTPGDMPGVLAEVVASRPDIILVHATDLAVAARRATATIPIVFGSVGDPIGNGVIASLAHPGGNATGLSGAANETADKLVTIMKETLPP